jgi:hypothetical protein
MSKPLTITEVQRQLIEMVSAEHPDNIETDNDGQLVFHMGIYRWADGSYHDVPEPKP